MPTDPTTLILLRVGPRVVTDSAPFNWVGASCPTENTGEISANYHTLNLVTPRNMPP